jgi:shikimate dehydrogenase
LKLMLAHRPLKEGSADEIRPSFCFKTSDLNFYRKPKLYMHNTWPADSPAHTAERLFGLIGYPLSHSFSKRYFSEKFATEGIDNAFYELFPIETIEKLPGLLAQWPNLKGLNVTIPYKQAVLPYINVLDESAAAVGAVNVIKIKDKQLIGYNSDTYGFLSSLQAFLQENKKSPTRALVLGTGGAAKAVFFALKKLGIDYIIASRNAAPGQYSYADLQHLDLGQYPLIINTTPLGMSPHTETFPDLPYAQVGPEHLLYDLVYNPETTSFMQKGLERGAAVANGLAMLHGQAEKAWEIWNN